MDIDQEIKNFLKFWNNNKTCDLKISNGVIYTPGCLNDYHCCSKIFDLDGLAMALEELTQEKE